MENKAQERIVNISALMIIGIVLFFTVIRLFYGAELSDEAYAVAETYMVSRGALPFVNNWSQMPGFTLLLAPFVKLYTLIAGSTDGIFLFFRFLSFFINVLTALIVGCLLRDHIKNRIMLMLFSMIYVGATGWDYVAAFRGDRVAIDLQAVGFLLIITHFFNDRDDWRALFASGILLALSALAYPVAVIEFVYFAIAIGFLCFRKKRGYKDLTVFLLGAALAAIIVVFYLAANSSISDIFIGIRYILNDVTYFRLRDNAIIKLIVYMVDMTRQVVLLLALFSTCFLFFLIMGIAFDGKNTFQKDSDYYSIKRIHAKRMALISLVFGVCLYHLYQIWRFKTGDSINISLYAMTAETLAVPLVWAFVDTQKRLCKYLMSFIWCPTCIWVIVTGISAHSGMLERHSMLKNPAYLLGVFVFLAVNDTFTSAPTTDVCSDKEGSLNKFPLRVFSKTIPVALMAMILFTHLFNSYTYVYRDESVFHLNAVISEGPYKGMHTTEIRAAGLIEVDRIIDQYIDEDDYILAMDNNPFLYLMSKGKICTPSTWDMALYSYGFNQPDLYYDYFSVTNIEPTKIVYYNYGRDDVMSIDVEYKFNDYVSRNYHKIYENRNLPGVNYNREVCELIIFERN